MPLNPVAKFKAFRPAPGRFSARFKIPTFIFIGLFLFGAIVGQKYMNISYCFRLLGCNIGFFGYDGLMHLVSGIGVFFLILRWSRTDFLSDASAKNTLRLIGLLFLIAISWEGLEFLHDHILDAFAFFNEIRFLRPDNLAQPNLIDTIGDVVSSTSAGFLAFAACLFYIRRKYQAPAPNSNKS